ncbi:MAG: CotH kinase family protein [Prolixibacteraceae bacterium]|nr:CotH kinase family protein [Prolixibacteraceae bacterium]
MRKISIFLILAVGITFFIPGKVFAQIFINEFQASNTGVIVDPEYNESADWLELYNAGILPVNLGGYYITDNFNDPTKWQIPSGVIIDAKGFLIIWADGYNTGLHASFKISADGEQLAVLNSSRAFIDSVSFGIQEPNISMGRKPDGGPEWNYFTEPSPQKTNSTENFDGIVKSIPRFSPVGGIFNNPITVSITNSFGGDIRYTLDGSEPNESSPVANTDIQITQTTVVRARIFKPGNVPGKTITNTYFIDGDNTIGNLPVVSLSSDPANFWDAEKGIYVQDFKPEWEIPVNIELFENDGSDRAGFNLAAGIKVNGLYSWQLPQKMLGVYFRKEYGEGNLKYPLLFDRDRNSFDDFALRASGSDWAYTLFRDAMTQRLTHDNMEIDYQGTRACVVFINGRYMGIHNIRSKINEDYIVQNHHLGDQKIDMIENENYVEAGSIDQYAAFEELYHNDLSIQENYNAVANLMDIENFTDFVITEIYSQNTSVDHNIMAWKPQDGGKWKWIVNDLDRGFFNAGNNLISFYANKSVIPLSNLLENDGYKKYFGKRLADQLFTTFDPERVKSIIDDFKTKIEDEIPRHINRWEGTSSSYGNPIPSVSYWENEIEKMKVFAENRPSALLVDLTNYGFQQSQPLAVSVFPEKAGTITFNGIKLANSYTRGGYPENEEITLNTAAKSGYLFKGWKRLSSEILLDKEQVWKYNDTGEEISASWITSAYDDSNWAEGQAELGYGDGNENTVISYGSSSGNKIITSYFRKTFQVENIAAIKSVNIQLKCDDGAVVYLNGNEVVRENLPAGEITPSTTALDGVSGSAEVNFTLYSIDKTNLVEGENLVAVEVHQVNSTSSDLSFDIEISAVKDDQHSYYSTNPEITFTHAIDEEWTAIYESDGGCILPELISDVMILNKDCSPYKVPNDVLITSTGQLIIEPGVELWISDGVTIEINGSLNALGEKDDPIQFKAAPGETKWGILNFVNADSSYLMHVIIEDASKGLHPLREIAAVSVYHSTVVIDGAVIENVYENPVLGRYSDITLKNSRLHSKITGDLINVKYGKGFIDSCTFIGNDKPDTDAIDYDDVVNGIIKNSLIHDFHGINSDAIDIGEQAKNITIENTIVYNITDKGVSVGQQSSVNILNSVFVNCNLGAGLKDSSTVIIDHCTYYGNGVSVACYEKNEGDAGGNAFITNSILSNAYESSYSSDSKSTIHISYSASDNETLPAGKQNLFVEPKFINPNLFDFRLNQASACLAAGSDGNIGANVENLPQVNFLFVSGIAYKSNIESETNEFIELSNSGATSIDISGYAFTKGITFTFPEGSIINPKEKVYVAWNSAIDYWQNKNKKVYQWESGRLADEGESIQLETTTGIVIDKVEFLNTTPWPDISNGEAIALKSADLDNHFGENWEVVNLDVMVFTNEITITDQISAYPNPTRGIINFSGLGATYTTVDVFDISGIKLRSEEINSSSPTINLSGLSQGVYYLRSNSFSKKVVLLK